MHTSKYKVYCALGNLNDNFERMDNGDIKKVVGECGVHSGHGNHILGSRCKVSKDIRGDCIGRVDTPTMRLGKAALLKQKEQVPTIDSPTIVESWWDHYYHCPSLPAMMHRSLTFSPPFFILWRRQQLHLW